MPKFTIRATDTITYEFEVEADTIEEAVAAVEDGDATDMREVDSTGDSVTHYTTDGQADWVEWKGEDEKTWFTVWVADAHSHGTHFVQAFLADDIDDAKAQALAECMACWDRLVDEVTVLGVCEGDVRVLEWNEENA